MVKWFASAMKILRCSARPSSRVGAWPLSGAGPIWLVSPLFLPGYAFGRIAGRRPLWTGLGMVLLGGALVGLTIALGG